RGAAGRQGPRGPVGRRRHGSRGRTAGGRGGCRRRGYRRGEPRNGQPARGVAGGAAGDTPSAPAEQPAVSVFTRGSEVVYAAELYDGRDTKGEPLSTQTTLLRDGQPLYTTPPAPLSGAGNPAGQPGPSAVPVGGRLKLGPTFPAGS